MVITAQQFIVPVGMEHLSAEIQFVQDHWEALISQYKGQYIAVMGSQVVAFNADDIALAQKMYAQFGNVPFYIAEISEMPTVYQI